MKKIKFLKKLLVLALILIASSPQMWGAWTGNAGICVNGTWYKASSNIDGGNWLNDKSTINGTNLGAITSLELGGEYQNWDSNQDDACNWNSNNGIWITITTNSGTSVDAFKLSCYRDSKSGENNVWKTTGSTGTCGDGSSWDAYAVDISDYAAGVYKLKVHWFSASGVALPSSGDDVATFTIDPVVTFKANGGTGSDYTQRVTYNTSTALTACTFSKAGGYSFAGWATASDGDVVYTDGASVTLTAHTDLYAKWTLDPTITLTSVSPSTSIIAGNDITLVGTRANSSNTISFEYTTNDGSTWTAITPKTSSLVSNALTITWTVPDAHGATQTFKFRAKLAEDTPIYSDKSSGVTVYNTKTLHVKNSNNWASLYLYAWNSGGETINGAWPGTSGAGSYGLSCTKIGGLWWNVVVTSQVAGFILNANVSGEDNQTVNLSYNSYSDDNCYAIGTNDGKKYMPNSPVDCLTDAAVSTSSVTPTVNNQATIGGNVTDLGNDMVTSYGYYYSSTNSSLAGNNLTGSTRVEVGTNKTSTGTYSKNQTGLTGGTTYYVIAYATNGNGTVYGSRQSFTTPYKVTLTNPTGGTFSSSGVKYVSSTLSVSITATTGYTFSSWSAVRCDMSSTSTTDGVTTATLTPSADNATLTASFMENSYSTTVVATNGSSPTSPQTIKQVTGTALTATPNTNFVFDHWTIANGGLAFKSPSTSTSNPATFTATSTGGTITAVFEDDYCILGNGGIMGDWDTHLGLPSTASNTFSKSYTLTKGLTYTFKIHKRSTNTYWGNTKDKGLLTITRSDSGSGKSLSSGGGTGDNIKIVADVTGSYTFSFNSSSEELTVTFPAAYSVTYNSESFYNGGASHETSTNGGTISAVDNNSAELVSGTLVAATGGTATMTAAKETGYTFDGWYSDANCATAYTNGSGGATISGDGNTVLTLASLSGNKTVYAKFSEKMTTVALSATNGKIQYWTGSAWADAPSSESVGVHTTCSIKAVPNTGYYFAGWTNTAGSDYSITGSFDSESNNNTTLSGNGGGSKSGQTLTANFVELDKVYFKNIFDDGAGSVSRWDNVYVFFDINWNGNGQVVPHNIEGDGDAYRTPMTQIGATDVYWAYVPRAFTKKAGDLKNIAFSDKYFAKDYTFYNKDASASNAAGRGDYNRALNMFVPYHTAKHVNLYGVDYYDNGFWMKHDTRANQGAGYYLKKYNSTGNYTDKGELLAIADNATTIQLTIRVDATSDAANKYMFTASGGLNYVADATITSTSDPVSLSDNTLEIASNDVYFQLKATAEGDYTFVIDQSGDKMKLSVIYPISTGDYRLKHTYNSGAKTTYSDIIKAGNASTTRTLSMFLSKQGTPTLVLQKCTVTDGVPAWSAGDDTNLSGVLSTVSSNGDGVYQFDVAVSGDQVSSAPTATLYDGPFYIKTDCAPGGWADYKSNEMTKNTINPSGFDYYFVKYVGGSTNVKCVVANDYCNQLSDTLKSDDILGGASDALPEGKAASVRFSYKSSTNALARAYISSSGDLKLIPNAASTVYDTTNVVRDLYGQDNGFSDDQNFTYYRYVKAVQGSQAGVKTTYNSHLQTFFENTNTLIGGSGSTKYLIRLVYDFKTNYITAAWTPDPESPINEVLSNIDVMLIREGQEAGTTITFGDKGSLTPQKLIGSLKFDYDDLYGKVSSWTETTRPKMMFFVSFPFDVKVSDLFGLNGNYGEAFIIRRYAGEKRAEKGFFRGDGTTTFWENLTTDSIMHAYEGYIVVLNNYYFNGTKGSIWFGKGAGSSVYLYFPSMQAGTISNTTKTITVPAHECKIDRTWHDDTLDRDLNHKNTDSHWNLIGVPVFTNETGDATAGTIGAVLATEAGADDAFNYYYKWNSGSNDFSINTARGETFGAMHGYMVQYKGDITFTGSVFAPAALAARRAPITENYNIELQVLDNNEEMVNHTYVELRENAHADFELNEDVYLSPNSHDAEIYSFAGDYDVAANVLPIENQSVQLGLNVHKAGTYTISMPSNFSGTATLVDTYTGISTNLALSDYEVELTEGAENERFILDINIHKVTTAIDGTTGDGNLKDGKAHKFIENGVMYILRDGKVYDATGAVLK